MSPDWVEHLDEGEGPHSDLTGALSFKTWLLIEGNQEVLTHEHRTTDKGQTPEILQVPPHQDGAFSLLAEGPVDCKNVDVDSCPMGFMDSQRLLERRDKEELWDQASTALDESGPQKNWFKISQPVTQPMTDQVINYLN